MIIIVFDCIRYFPKGNERICFVNKEAPCKVHNIKHDLWKQSYKVHVSSWDTRAPRVSTKGKKIWVQKLQILPALCNIVFTFSVKLY